MSRPEIKNRLLSRLSPADRSMIDSSLEYVALAPKAVLTTVNGTIKYVFFPEEGAYSLLAATHQASPIEVGMIGFEGMTDMVIDPGDVSYLRTVVQLEGCAWRISATDFAAAMSQSQSFERMAMRFKETLAVQFAYSAFAHGTFTIEERLARWILMAHDRAQREAFPIVHELMATMLAVRRSGITTAIHILEGAGAIRSTRGLITMRNREKLLEIAGDSYGVSEAAYKTIMAR